MEFSLIFADGDFSPTVSSPLGDFSPTVSSPLEVDNQRSDVQLPYIDDTSWVVVLDCT